MKKVNENNIEPRRAPLRGGIEEGPKMDLPRFSPSPAAGIGAPAFPH
jgi:hypothetical protein